MPSSAPMPPQIEDTTIPEAVRFNMQHNPQVPFYTYASQEVGELHIITHHEFGRAAHRAARALCSDAKGHDGQVVAIIALVDSMLYQTVFTGLIIAGLIPFPISPRNTPAAVVNMLQKTSCHRILTTEETVKSLLDGIKLHLESTGQEYGINIEEIPSIFEIYSAIGEVATDTLELIPLPATRPSLDAICIYIHSSGSTGLPKPIAHTHQTIIHWAVQCTLQFTGHVPPLIMATMGLPPFHAMGILTQVMNPIYGLIRTSLYPPVVTSKDRYPFIPSPSNVLEHARLNQCNVVTAVPTFIQIWSKSAEAVKYLQSLTYLASGGGSVNPRLAKFLIDSNVSLVTMYGGTEFGSATYLKPLAGDEKEWPYMRFHENTKTRWIPQGDGTFECQFLSWEKHRLCVENLEDVKGFATSDLWENHPTKKYLWKIVGRIDDVIIHSSGEKTVPAPIEDVVMSSEFIQGAVMFGREHDQAGILIESRGVDAIDVNDDIQIANFRNKIWPIIEEANTYAPAFSRIFKEMILITSKDKPLVRSGKGSVMRKAALDLYREEIEEIYKAVETAAVSPPEGWSEPQVEVWLRTQATDLSGKDIVASHDLFEQGFDSLSATFLRHRIVGSLKSSNDVPVQKAAQGFTQNSIFLHPTIEKLSAHIMELLAMSEKAPATVTSRTSQIEEMIEKYSKGLEGTRKRSSRPLVSIKTVLLTGSSGNLGSHILALLLNDDRVNKVYAFNRPSATKQTILERHATRFEDRGLDVDLLTSEKITYLTGDAAQAHLGLDYNLYRELRDSVDVIIHNAWKLDFNLSLSSYENHIRATRNIIDLALEGPTGKSIRFLFASSVASAQSWPQDQGSSPETVIEDASVAVGLGYGESKYVAERIIAKSGLQATSLRIGQVTGGPPNGAWPATDWVPILVKSSVAMGILPVTEGVVSWLPADAVARAILDVVFVSQAPPAALNLVHPDPIGWNSVISIIKDAIKGALALDLKLVPFQDWFSQLELRSTNASSKDLASIPALKLLDFFRILSEANAQITTSDKEIGGQTTFESIEMQRVSPTIRGLRKIEREDVIRWVNYWQAVDPLVVEGDVERAT